MSGQWSHIGLVADVALYSVDHPVLPAISLVGSPALILKNADKITIEAQKQRELDCYKAYKDTHQFRSNMTEEEEKGS